jgi:hypothetical protein
VALEVDRNDVPNNKDGSFIKRAMGDVWSTSIMAQVEVLRDSSLEGSSSIVTAIGMLCGCCIVAGAILVFLAFMRCHTAECLPPTEGGCYPIIVNSMRLPALEIDEGIVAPGLL